MQNASKKALSVDWNLGCHPQYRPLIIPLPLLALVSYDRLTWSGGETAAYNRIV
jgi:hypothetical protein